GLARAFVAACKKAPGKHVAVPGGELSTPLGGVRAAPPATINTGAVRDLGRRTAKLSKLQRRILAFARDLAPKYGSAPLRLWGPTTRSEAAALSRALRRLEARDLIDVQRFRGRAVGISLTWDGKKVITGW